MNAQDLSQFILSWSVGGSVADSIKTGFREDAARSGVGLTRVLVRLAMNLSAYPLRFIVATPRPVPDQL